MCFDILVLDTRYWILDGYQMLTRGYLYLGYLQVGHPIKGMSRRWIALLWVTDKGNFEVSIIMIFYSNAGL